MLVSWWAQLIHTGPHCLGLERFLPTPGEKSHRGLGWRAGGALGGSNPPTALSPVSQPETSSVTAAHPWSLI